MRERESDGATTREKKRGEMGMDGRLGGWTIQPFTIDERRGRGEGKRARAPLRATVSLKLMMRMRGI